MTSKEEALLRDRHPVNDQSRASSHTQKSHIVNCEVGPPHLLQGGVPPWLLYGIILHFEYVRLA